MDETFQIIDENNGRGKSLQPTTSIAHGEIVDPCPFSLQSLTSFVVVVVAVVVVVVVVYINL